MVNIYVGNLKFQLTEEELKQAFEAHGEVSSCNIIRDRYSGESRGFGFVEMPNDAEANVAIEAMNGADVGGRNLTVNIARPREERGGGNRGGGGGRDRRY